MTDCIIIGSGLAGISAALTLQANSKSFQLFGNKNLSDKIRRAEKIHNYPALSDVSGAEFCNALQKQLDDSKITITEEKVSGIYPLNGKFGLATFEGGYYESKTVVLGLGVEAIKPIEGELAFMGRGVSYCATCDGMLYKGKTIAVLCTSKSLEHEVEFLADLAEKVYLIAMYKDVEVSRENVIVLRKMPVKLFGEKRVNGLLFASAPSENIPQELSIDGVFVLRESVSPAALLGGLEMENGHVKVDRNMQTNVKGCFAAGDCTGKPYQYAKAVGEGNVAAHSVVAYLNEMKKRENTL